MEICYKKGTTLHTFLIHSHSLTSSLTHLPSQYIISFTLTSLLRHSHTPVRHSPSPEIISKFKKTSNTKNWDLKNNKKGFGKKKKSSRIIFYSKQLTNYSCFSSCSFYCISRFWSGFSWIFCCLLLFIHSNNSLEFITFFSDLYLVKFLLLFCILGMYMPKL